MHDTRETLGSSSPSPDDDGPCASTPGRRRPTPSINRLFASSDDIGSWTDATDTADRAAHARARSGDGYERPPHW